MELYNGYSQSSATMNSLLSVLILLIRALAKVSTTKQRIWRKGEVRRDCESAGGAGMVKLIFLNYCLSHYLCNTQLDYLFAPT